MAVVVHNPYATGAEGSQAATSGAVTPMLEQSHSFQGPPAQHAGVMTPTMSASMMATPTASFASPTGGTPAWVPNESHGGFTQGLGQLPLQVSIGLPPVSSQGPSRHSSMAHLPMNTSSAGFDPSVNATSGLAASMGSCVMASSAAGNASGGQQPPPTFDEVSALSGSLPEHARTATGSSFLQAALHEDADPRNPGVIWSELAPCLADLLLDAHGCYVIRNLLDRLPQDDVSYVLQSISAAEALSFSLCTHSLHTRRVVQHVIERIDGNFLCSAMAEHCAEIATTQQGCIVLQRSMDHATGEARAALLHAACRNAAVFASNPFANYVLQHALEVGDRDVISDAVWEALRGHVVPLSCNKFASNVIEKCLFHMTAEAQHEMLMEMYSSGADTLLGMLQDSYGNYIIQSSIALAMCRDVPFIDQQLRPVLGHTPYGHKIEARLDRRLKGKAVTSRADRGDRGGNEGRIGANSGRRGGKRHEKRGGHGHHTSQTIPVAAAIPEGESAW